MKITPKWKHCEGSFDTKEVEMVCIAKRKYSTVALAIKDGMSYTIAEIRLSDSNLWAMSESTFDDAEKLGEEIARRWNECEVKK